MRFLLTDIDIEYLQIFGMVPNEINPEVAAFYFGQKFKLISTGQIIEFNDTKGRGLGLKDNEGNNLEFYSMVDALNYASKNGFEFISSDIMYSGNYKKTIYLLRNRKYIKN